MFNEEVDFKGVFPNEPNTEYSQYRQKNSLLTSLDTIEDQKIPDFFLNINWNDFDDVLSNMALLEFEMTIILQKEALGPHFFDFFYQKFQKIPHIFIEVIISILNHFKNQNIFFEEASTQTELLILMDAKYHFFCVCFVDSWFFFPISILYRIFFIFYSSSRYN